MVKIGSKSISRVKCGLSLKLAALSLLPFFPVSVVMAEQSQVPTAIFLDAEFPVKNLEKCIAQYYPVDDLSREIDSSKKCLSGLDLFEKIEVDQDQNQEGKIVNYSLQLKRRINLIVINGVESSIDRKLKRQIGVKEGDWFVARSIETSSEKIVQLLKPFGYYSPKVKVAVRNIGSYPLVVIDYQVSLGKQANVTAVTFSQPPPAELMPIVELFESDIKTKAASQEEINDFVRDLRSAVRAEGYLQALVALDEIKYLPESGDAEIVLRVDWKEPVTFYFNGNSSFSEVELLQQLRLQTRVVPFSANAVQSLVRAIERKYRENGYLDAEVSFVELAPVEGRRLFEINIVEGAQQFVSAVEFNGNESIPTGQLRERTITEVRKIFPLSIWQKGTISVAQLRADVLSLEQKYREEGFQDVSISYQMKREEDSTNSIIVFTIKEGKRSFINRVRFRWIGFVSLLSEDNQQGLEILRYKTSIKEGDPFSSKVAQKERKQIVELLLRSGFPNASVKADYNRDSGTLIFKINPGPFVTIGEITFRGNLLTKKFAVNKEMEITKGEIWDTEALLRSQQNLYNTGIFRSVKIVPADGQIDQKEEPLNVELVERDTGSLSGGVSYDTVDGIHVGGELAQRNYLGTGDKISLSADGYLRSTVEAGYARLQHVQRRVWNSEASFVNELYGQFAVKFIDQFSYDRAGYRATVRYPAAEDLSLSASLGAFSENVYDVDPRVIIDPADGDNNDLVELGVGLDYDRRDSPHLPTQGYRSQVKVGAINDPINSDLSLIDFKTEQSLFFRPLSRLVWANNLRFQFVESLNDQTTVPLNRRLFLGGRDSLRGYGRYTVSPRGDGGIAVGGDRSLDGTTELRYKVVDNFVAIGFFDFGVAYLSDNGSFLGDPLKIEDLRYSPGLGFAYETPVGPLSFEYGFALDRDPSDEFGRFAVSIGSRF